MSEPMAVGLLVGAGVWGLMYVILAEMMDRRFWNHRRKLDKTTRGEG